MECNESLDLRLCEAVGVGHDYDVAELNRLLSRKLVMSPHPEWRLPDSIDWSVDPFDKNWRFQFNMLRWADPLRAAGAAGNLNALREWERIARDWWEKNPTDAPQSPEAWMDMTDGLRTLRLITAAPLLAEHMPDSLPWLTEAIVAHRDWLADASHWGHSNHLLHQMQGLAAAAAVTNHEDHMKLAEATVRELFFESWDEQGVNAEGALAYHFNNLIWWREALNRFRAAGMAEIREAKWLDKTPIELAHATRPDGTLAPIGDTDITSVKRIDHPATNWVTTGGAEGEHPDETVKLYDDGYLFARSGWGEFERDFSQETFFSLTFGKYKVHGHEDGGSITFSADGVNWLTDPGRYSYTPSAPMRKHVLERQSHSVTYIEGARRNRSAPVKLVSKEIRPEFVDVELEDAGSNAGKIYRRVIYSRSGEYLILVDRINMHRDGTAVQRWQLGPNVEAKVGRQCVRLSQGSAQAAIFYFGRQSSLQVVRNVDGSSDGLVATGWKKTARAHVVLARKDGRRERFISIIVPGHGVAPNVTRVTGLPPRILAFNVKTRRMVETAIVLPECVHILSGESDATRVNEYLESLNSSIAESRPTSPHERDKWRDYALDQIVAAKSLGWFGSEETRISAAESLESLRRSAPMGQSGDAGLQSAVTDLRQIPSGEIEAPGRGGLINWGNDPSWSALENGAPSIAHWRAMSPQLLGHSAELHVVDLGELTLPLYWIPRHGNTLTVVFHGAIDRAKIKRPVFLRQQREAQQHSDHLLYVSDPTLDLSPRLRLGWYLGTGKLDLVPHIANAIQEVAEHANCKNVILRGSSGGGFAALHVAAYLDGAKTVVFNPQTDIRAYHATHSQEAMQVVFGESADFNNPAIIARVSAIERFRRARMVPDITYVNNAQDGPHIERHYAPFCDQMELMGLGERIRVVSHDFGGGHRPPPVEVDDEVMSLVRGELN